MKRTLLVAIALTGFVSVNAMAQDEVKKEAQKEVKMEVIDGVKTLTITWLGGQLPAEEVYTGEEAERKMAELEAEKKEDSIEIKVVNIGGEKQLTIVTTKNGIATEERFVGEAADAKMKEMEAAESGAKKIMIIEKTEKIEKVVE